MYNWGLLLLGTIQIGTALMIYVSVYKAAFFEIAALPASLSHYRYMLTALWLSVGAVYVVGAFNRDIAPGAVLLGAVNTTLEIIGYWMGVRAGLMPAWYAVISTLTIGGTMALSIWLFLGMV